MSGNYKGYMAGLGAAAAYGMNPLFALPLYSEGLSVWQVLFWRYLWAIPLMGLLVWWRGDSLRVSRSALWRLVILGVLMGFSSLALFTSYQHMDAGIASTLLFVYPLMVAVLMTIFFRERLQFHTVVCLFLAMLGIWMLFYRPGGESLSVIGTLWVMASSLAYAVYIVMVRDKVLRQLPASVLTFYVIASGWILFAALTFATGMPKWPGSAIGAGSMVGLALVPTVVSLVLTNLSIQLVGSTSTAILGVFEPVTAIFFGITVFGETLTGRDIVGLLCILLAVTYVIAASKINPLFMRLWRGRHP